MILILLCLEGLVLLAVHLSDADLGRIYIYARFRCYSVVIENNMLIVHLFTGLSACDSEI